MPGDDLRWAVMGTGRIAAGVLPKLIAARGNQVVAIASRHAEQAASLSAKVTGNHGISPITLNYEQLLADPRIDAVYVTLPHSLHAEWSLRLLEAGKHVLCEKPLCATKREAEALRSAAARAGKICVEGFMYMHHPQTARLVELGRIGSELGPLRVMRSNRNVHQTDPYILSSRMNHELQGGSLMDLGCYPLSLALLVADSSPRWETLRASARFGRWIGDSIAGEIEHAAPGIVPPGFVDESCAFAFDFERGARVEAECSFTKGSPNGASVFFEMIGERGRAYTTHPFSPDPTRQTLTVEIDGVSREEVFEHAGDKFVNQFERFARAARGETEPFPSMDWSALEAEAIERIHAAISLRW